MPEVTGAPGHNNPFDDFMDHLQHHRDLQDGINNIEAGVFDGDASDIPFTPAGTIAATDVQAAIEEVAAEATGGSFTGDAADVTFDPAGTIAATDVQAAVEEVATDAATALTTHAADTTSVHGIPDTAQLTTVSDVTFLIDAHATDLDGAHVATAVTVDSAPLVGTAVDVQGVLEELDNGIADHLADATAAHAASAVSVSSTTLVGVGTDAQAVFEELDDAIAAHIADASDAHLAATIGFDDDGLGITATTVQEMGEALDAAVSAGGISGTILDAKGDLIVASAADTPTRFAAGADYTVPSYLAGASVGITASAPRALPYIINEQTGTSYTLVLTDAGKRIDANNASPFTLTIPANASVAFPVGTEVTVFNKGAGQVTVAITTDTLNKPTLASTVLIGQGSWAVLEKISSTVWNITGELVTRVRTTVQLQTTDPNGAVVITGDGQGPRFIVPADLNGYDLVAVQMAVTTVSSSGIPTVQIRNVTQTADMLTTKLTVDASEKSSHTAAAAAVIDTGNDDVATGDEIAIDVDVAGTGTKGISVTLVFS